MMVIAILIIYFTFVSVSGKDRTPVPQGKITWKLKTIYIGVHNYAYIYI